MTYMGALRKSESYPESKLFIERCILVSGGAGLSGPTRANNCLSAAGLRSKSGNGASKGQFKAGLVAAGDELTRVRSACAISACSDSLWECSQFRAGKRPN